MAKINILPAKVYNRIAAGEVVDRPYSVVKELVENAIDAGATEIEIDIEQGGKQLIQVIDNGCGIARDDLQSAFLPHATSKISKAEDLESVLTLGFRGEAVASIASVSRMTIVSKVKGEKCYSLQSDCGELGQIEETAGEDGTTVCVEMLFYNTPVRLGFLKSDKAEEADITTFVSRFILNRPEIAFTYYANGKKLLQSFGGGAEEAMVAVYGAATLSECYQINADKHGVRVRGFIGNQNYFKANKSYQSVFLNGRYIQNQTIAAAMTNAYASYAMKRQYPFYVLYIDVPAEIVDVNVHPNKADVRFADNKIIYGSVYSVVAAVLDGQTKALDYVVKGPLAKAETTDAPTPKPKSESLSAAERYEQKAKPQSMFGITTVSYEEARREMDKCAPMLPREKPFETETSEDDLPPLDEEKWRMQAAILREFDKRLEQEDFSRFHSPESDERGFFPAVKGKGGKKSLQGNADDGEKRNKKKKADEDTFSEKYPDLYFEPMSFYLKDPSMEEQNAKSQPMDYFAENKKFLATIEKKNKQNRIDVSACMYAGKLFNTYLLYECGDCVYIIDQHAAHERLIFDRLREDMRVRDVVQQPMLIPYEISVNAEEREFLSENLASIRAMGFDMRESKTGTFVVTGIPADLQNIDLAAFFNEILSDISGYRAIKLTELLHDKLASAACKAAVKGGMNLTQDEIDALFSMMDGDMGLKCPHGRPVVVKMARTELEKMFKRIV